MGGKTNNKRLRKRRNREAAQAPKRSEVWITWGLPAAAVVIFIQLLYLFGLAESQGGASVLGVLVCGACGWAASCFRMLAEYAGGGPNNQGPDDGGNPLLANSVASAAVTVFFVPVQLIFFN